LFYGSFTQIALGIAIAEVCAGKKLKNKTILYGSILGTIPDLDVVGLFFRSCAVLIHRASVSLFLFFIFISSFRLDYFKTGKRIDFLHASHMALGVCYPCIRYVYLLGTQILWPLDYGFALKQSL
jgi:inner membrane protein